MGLGFRGLGLVLQYIMVCYHISCIYGLLSLLMYSMVYLVGF